MTMFAKRFKRFMRSNKGRQFQKKMKDSRMNLLKRKTLSYAMNAKSRDTSSLSVLNGRKEGQVNKSLRLMLLLGMMRIHRTTKFKK
ncbi:hypothetical protein Gogos_015083 [Gossypium gossypioides]|uniref:Uncharacterized protein n=1 Tax=Gossypium gossypioides TaxID=34282 RepID=A0A7J9C0M4_GOSGO|nr:hypothetical protein [Gossypium gossypioides]